MHKNHQLFTQGKVLIFTIYLKPVRDVTKNFRPPTDFANVIIDLSVGDECGFFAIYEMASAEMCLKNNHSEAEIEKHYAFKKTCI